MRHIPEYIIYFTGFVSTICGGFCFNYFNSNKTVGIWLLFVTIIFGLFTGFLIWQNDIWSNQILNKEIAQTSNRDKALSTVGEVTQNKLLVSSTTVKTAVAERLGAVENILKPECLVTPLTLRNIYDTDFSYASIDSEVTLSSLIDEKEIKLPFRLLMDFDSKAKFLSFFIESSPFAYDECVAIANSYQSVIDIVDRSVIMSTSIPGESSGTASKDLLFSSRIYIYYENELSLQQLASLENIFKSKSISVQFRGNAYHVLHWDEKRIKRPTASQVSVPK